MDDDSENLHRPDLEHFKRFKSGKSIRSWGASWIPRVRTLCKDAHC